MPAGEVDHPLVVNPLKLVGADWNGDRLRLIFDRPPTRDWIEALNSMSNFQSLMGAHPRNFVFRNSEASVVVDGSHAQQVIDIFKTWIPSATERLKQEIEQAERSRVAEEQRALLQAQEALLARQKVMGSLRV